MVAALTVLVWTFVLAGGYVLLVVVLPELVDVMGG